MIFREKDKNLKKKKNKKYFKLKNDQEKSRIFSSTRGGTTQTILDLVSLIARFEIVYYKPKINTCSLNYEQQAYIISHKIQYIQ